MKNDLNALFKLEYGLYVITCKDGDKDNGLIVNTVMQVTNTPNRILVALNKSSYSHEIIKKTGMMNINCLTAETPFSIIQNFGYQSGMNTNKFDELQFFRSENDIAVLSNHINAYISLQVEKYVEYKTHGLFFCSVAEAEILSDIESLTYSYYQSHIKPKPETKKKKGFICKICGYIYEGETLPDDFICPICLHGVADFEPLENT